MVEGPDYEEAQETIIKALAGFKLHDCLAILAGVFGLLLCIYKVPERNIPGILEIFAGGIIEMMIENNLNEETE